MTTQTHDIAALCAALDAGDAIARRREETTMTRKLVPFQKCETRIIRDWWVGILVEAGVPHEVKEKQVVTSNDHPDEEDMFFEVMHYFIDVPAPVAAALRAAKYRHPALGRPEDRSEQSQELGRLRPLFLAAAREAAS
jgi:hypothetical protein